MFKTKKILNKLLFKFGLKYVENSSGCGEIHSDYTPANPVNATYVERIIQNQNKLLSKRIAKLHNKVDLISNQPPKVSTGTHKSEVKQLEDKIFKKEKENTASWSTVMSNSFFSSIYSQTTLEERIDEIERNQALILKHLEVEVETIKSGHKLSKVVKKKKK